jgi:hypothetical protein
MADISLKDPLQEIYEEVSPFEYRWKKYEKEAPKLDEDFKWNFLSEIKQPQLEIKGPSVGSLLYALNPQTSELGLKQMESELNQQLQANEMFDKRGEEALDFMEKRVQEDIANKKLQNVDAGHANSLLANYTQAIQSGDATAIAIAEDRIRKTFPNADAILEQAKEKVALGKAQDDEYFKWASDLPDKWNNAGERKGYISNVSGAMNDGLITRKQGFELIGKANQTPDWATINKNTRTQAQINAGAGRGVKKTEMNLVEKKFKELKAKYPSMSDAEALDRATELVGVK